MLRATDAATRTGRHQIFKALSNEAEEEEGSTATPAQRDTPGMGTCSYAAYYYRTAGHEHAYVASPTATRRT